jgi:AcrR family transcriptional regulator
MEVPAVAKQATAEKRQRRERGSINPDDIISGAFELAEQVSIDNLSMPLLGKHLGVGVTSIYWYFRKKDDLLNAMTDRALRKYVFATPYVEAKDWRETLRNHARSMRKTFMGNPILCDLILIRSALSPRAARLGRDCRRRKPSTPTPRCRFTCEVRWYCIGSRRRTRRRRTGHAQSRMRWSSIPRAHPCWPK